MSKNKEKPFIKYNLNALLEGKQVKSKQLYGEKAKLSPYYLDGYRLDHVYLAAELFTQEDIQELIDFLKCTKYGLPKAKKDKPTSSNT